MDVAKRKPDFPYFCQSKAQVYLAELWQKVAPLTFPPAPYACQELSAIVSLAQTIAVDMYSLPLEYKLKFAQPEDPFSRARMVDRSPVTSRNMDTSQQADARATVSLGISPTFRVWNGAQEMRVGRRANLGNVLLSGRIR